MYGSVEWIGPLEQQYATATNLQTRISIHDKYSTNKMGFELDFSNYKIDPGMRVLELGCRTGDMWKNKEDLTPSVFQADSFRFFKSDDQLPKAISANTEKCQNIKRSIFRNFL